MFFREFMNVARLDRRQEERMRNVRWMAAGAMAATLSSIVVGYFITTKSGQEAREIMRGRALTKVNIIKGILEEKEEPILGKEVKDVKKEVKKS